MSEDNRVRAEEKLSALQIQVLQTFFALPQGQEFVVVGGAALIIHGIVERGTEDLDLFNISGHLHANVLPAADALRTALANQGISCELTRASVAFVALHISNDVEKIVVDMAVDGRLPDAPVLTVYGPTPSLETLGGLKLLALMHRAAPRDFTDVYRLALLLGRDEIHRRAQVLDSGCVPELLATAMRARRRIPEDRLPISETDRSPMIAFFEEWMRDLQAR